MVVVAVVIVGVGVVVDVVVVGTGAVVIFMSSSSALKNREVVPWWRS